jgi:phosphoglucosamine mutase
VKVANPAAVESEGVVTAIKAAEKRLGNRGRILVRKSGTEPLVRIMAEGDEESVIRAIVSEIADAVRKSAQAA